MNRMRLMILIIVFSVFCSTITAKPREWTSATVAAIDSRTENRGSAAIPVMGSLYFVPLSNTTVWYRIETDEKIYVLAWSGKQHPLNLTLYGQTKISIDGANAHILDDAGKDVKVPIVQRIAKHA